MMSGSSRGARSCAGPGSRYGATVRIAAGLASILGALGFTFAVDAHAGPGNQRLAVVIDESLGGARRGASDLEGALMEGLTGHPGLVFVDASRAEAVRAAAKGGSLLSANWAALVEAADADMLLLGEVELVEADAGLLAGVASVEATARLRLVAADSAQVLGALRARAVGAHYASRFAAAKAVEALARDLLPKMKPLLDRSPARLRLTVELSAPVDGAAVTALGRCLEDTIGEAQVVFHGADRLELEVNGAAEPMAETLVPGHRCGVEVHARSARALRARYRAPDRIPLRWKAFRPQRSVSSHQRWLAEELPRVVYGELLAEAVFEPARKEAGTKSGVTLTGSFAKAGRSVRISAQLELDGKAVLVEQAACPSAEVSRCALELGQTLAQRAHPALRAHRGRLGRAIDPAPDRTGPVRIDQVVAGPIYSAQLASYENRAPVGRVRVTHSGDRPALGVVVAAKLDGLAERLSLSEPVDLAPGQTADLPVSLWLDRAQIGALVAPRTFPLEVELRFEHDGFTQVVRRRSSALVYAKNALRWSESPNSAVAFVDSKAQGLAAWVREARSAAADSDHPLAEPAALFAAMSTLRYAKDAANPFDPEGVDDVRFPAETLVDGEGDCDDLAVLYASLLEASGVPALLLLTPGHVLVAAGTGLSPTSASRLDLDPDATLVHGGQLFVPVETTAVGKPFDEAWKRAARSIAKLRRAGGEPAVISVREHWPAHPPAGLCSAVAPAPASLDGSELAARLAELEAARVSALSERLERLSAEKTSAALNEAGVLLALEDRHAEARRALEASIAQGPNPAAENNLGNLELLDARPRKALARYERSLSIRPGRIGVLLNAVLAGYLVALDDEGAQGRFTELVDQALELDPAGLEAFLARLPHPSMAPAGEVPLAGLALAIQSRRTGAAPSGPRAASGLTASDGMERPISAFVHWDRE